MKKQVKNLKKNEVLAGKFIKELGNWELSPAMHNTGFLIQATLWNTSKYFQEAYDSKKPFPLLLLMRGHEGLLYYPVGKAKDSAREVFSKYWSRPAILKEIDRDFKILDLKTDACYKKFVKDYSRLGRQAKNKLIKQGMDAAWLMNAKLFCSIYFDRPMAEELLFGLNSKITATRLNQIWDCAVDPVADSFDVRRQRQLIGLIKQNKPLDEIIWECLFFETSYEYLPSKEELKALFEKKFGKLLQSKEALIYLKKIDQERAIKNKKHQTWLKQLSVEEKKLVKYIQAIIRWRDERKDAMAKLSTMLLLLGKESLSQVGADEELAIYCLVDEILRGPKYLKSLVPLLEKRRLGSVVLVHGSGKKELEYGKFSQTQKTLEKFLVQQNKTVKGREILGQVGAPGKIKGRVRVINNFRADSGKFKKGEILVAGMTRPEYVPLMKKSIAIITDEGGITCHAAIVARELKKPCVIATKIATKVLRDGDLVEVDADKGIVRIIK